MKLNDNFVLRQVAGTWIVLPLAAASVDFNSVLTLNETSVLLWRALERGGNREDLADAITAEYKVSRERALADIDEFLEKLAQDGYLELP